MIAQQLGSFFRQSYLANPDTHHQLLSLLTELLTVPGHNSPKQKLEIILLTAAANSAGYSENQTTLNNKPQAVPLQTSAPQNSPASKHIDTTPPKPKPTKQRDTTNTKVELSQSEVQGDAQEVVPVAAPAVATAVPRPDDQDAEELWHDVLQDIKQNHNTLYGIARMAKPHLVDNTLILQLKFAFHLKRIQEAKNHKILTTCIEKLRGKPTTLQCELAEVGQATEITPTATGTDVSAISNIFGGAELL
jgi:hypothetical protein